MFQINSRSTSITFNESERAVINEKIKAFQEKKGTEILSIKELFTQLLVAATSENVPAISKTEENENTALDTNSIVLTGSIEEINELKGKLNDFTEKHSIDAETPQIEIIDFALKTAMKTPEIIEVEKEVTKVVEKQLSENQILVTLTDDKNGTIEKKLILLDEISKRRSRKLGIEETIPGLIEKMIFNDGTVFNLGGEFYTGF